ncbi:RrF2 family transcriptional regulator [Seonamhaeicola marinus]|uniref:Rrf2 family transcriptional regulator n=1 Tax=Seonamhaeicola marinus TaxID=1912246 RepID=A0A5D0HT58_9FLAO|nr:Rrf2 family transcriptional regulator [Seonamhaeicola marinus]TYA74488.1 Rrf2 family transcriptional regulator [Seonamhaeicola marinus]
MLSNSTKYALKAVLFLALHSTFRNKIMVKDIAKPINVPQAYLAKLLQLLVKGNIVSSVRGVNGGFYLTEVNLEKSIMDILYAIEGEIKLNSCMLSLEKCNEDKPCPLHNILSDSKNDILLNFRKRTIRELAQEVKQGKAFLPL